MFDIKKFFDLAMKKGEEISQKLDYIYKRHQKHEEIEKGYRSTNCTYVRLQHMDNSLGGGYMYPKTEISIAWTRFGLDVIQDGKRVQSNGPQLEMRFIDVPPFFHK